MWVFPDIPLILKRSRAKTAYFAIARLMEEALKRKLALSVKMKTASGIPA
jgi:hypothetical protein